MDIHEIRKNKLKELINTVWDGSKANLANDLGIGQSYISRYFSSKSDHKRNIGSKRARQIEKLAKKPSGWMDSIDNLKLNDANQLAANEAQIPHLDTVASMGNGEMILQQAQVIDMVRVNIHGLKRKAPSFTHVNNLRILTGIGASMSPTFEDGDSLLVDTGITSIKVDAIYVMQRKDELFIKRMQRMPDGRMMMKSDNTLYDSYPIDDPEEDGFQVLGRIISVWNMRNV